jgi:hypothetical protein
MQETLFPANDNEAFGAENFWVGLDIEKLPRTGSEAALLGLTFFYSGEECVHGHLAPKYAKGGRCVVCSTEFSTRKQFGRPYGGSFKRARANLKRTIAAMEMKRTYEPAFPCKHGHRMRFVSSNNCVECDLLARDRRREKAKEERLQKKYGISGDDKENMALAQDYSCAICEEKFEDNRKLHVDHCHATGKVRGLLCSQCNQAIGLFRESRAALLSAVAYLDMHRSAEAA